MFTSMDNRYKILHVDDDIYIRKVIQHTLNADFEVISCVNGVEAMAWLEQGNQPDLILTDLRMPLLDGKDFIELVRHSSLYHHVPIIVLSSNEDSSQKISCLEQGADDFMAKPFNPLEVKARIKAHLRRTTMHRTFRPNFDLTHLSPLR